MDFEYLQSLRNYLFGFISENKQQKFNEIIQNRTRHITVVLENVFQAQNTSAVMRSCDLFGIQDLHIIENVYESQVDPNVAMGASKWLNLNYYTKAEFNTKDCFDTLRSKGYKIVATTPHKNDCLIDDLPLDDKFALVFGTELTGLSDYALENADAYVKVPMYGFTESFNISVSAALSVYHLTEKLRKSAIDWHLSQEEIVQIHVEWAKRVIRMSDQIVEKFDAKYPLMHTL